MLLCTHPMLFVRGDLSEIRTHYTNEYPALQDPVRAGCSYHCSLVGLTADEIISQANEYSDRSKDLEALIRIEELKEKAFTLTPEAVTFFLEKLLEKAETGNATLSTFWDFIRCIKINGCIAEIYFNYTAVPATLDNPIRVKIETNEECSNDDVLVGLSGFEPETSSM